MDDLDEEFRDLEAELRRLRPVGPSQRLRAAIATEFCPKAKPRPQTSPLGAAIWWRLAVPLAAAAAVGLAWWPGSAAQQSAKSVMPATASVLTEAGELFRPVAAAALPLATRDEALVTLADGTLARRTRETSLATITWKNPRTQASLTWSVPREEVRLVPVSFQ